MGQDHRLYQEFGARLRSARAKAGLSQESLGERVALSRTSISNIESGRQRILIHMVYLLAGAVGVAPSDLLPEWGQALEPTTAQQPRTDDVEEEEGWIRTVIDSVAEGGASAR